MAQFNDYVLSAYGGIPSIERRYRDDSLNNLTEDLNYDIRDRTETDVDFMNALYRNTHPDYFLGSWVVKPIVEILLHFLGMPKAVCEDKALEKMLNETYKIRSSEMLQLFRELGLYGTEWVILGYDHDLEIPNITPRNNSFVVSVRYDDPIDQDNPTYVKIRTYANVSVTKQGDDNNIDNRAEDVIIDQEYWREMNPKYKKLIDGGLVKEARKHDRYIYHYRVKRKGEKTDWVQINNNTNNIWKTIPVIPFHQNRLSSDRYGYSDVSGLVRLTGVYHQILESSIDTVLYNSKPIPVFTGLASARGFIDSMYGDVDSGTPTQNMGYYDDMDSYYLEGDANVKYLELSSAQIDNAKALLSILFYIFVQTSGVPEYMLGAEMNATYASTSMQSTPLVQKIKSKRTDINGQLIKMNVAMAKIYEANTGKKFTSYKSDIIWKDTSPEDKDYILQALDRVLPLDILTPETILNILDIVSDPDAEIKKRQKQLVKEKMTGDEKQAVVGKIKEKIGKAKQEQEATGEMSDELSELLQIDNMLKAMMGEDYLSELGLEN